MVSYRVLTVAALTALSALMAVPAQAQTPVSPPSLNLSGQINGLCMLSQQQMLESSKAGQMVGDRLQQLAKEGDERFGRLGDRLSQDIQNFQQQAKTMQPQQREEEAKKLGARRNDFLSEKEAYGQRLRLTRARALNRIVTTAKPLVESAYASHHCGILLDRDSGVIGGNAANDLTDEVVKALDSKLPTITVTLASLPKGNAGK